MIRADRFFLAVVVFLGGACLAYGQAVSVAEASGVVADPSGSAIGSDRRILQFAMKLHF